MSDKLVLSLSEAAALLGLTKSQLYQLTRERSRLRQPRLFRFLRLGKRLVPSRVSRAMAYACEVRGDATDSSIQIPHGRAE